MRATSIITEPKRRLCRRWTHGDVCATRRVGSTVAEIGCGDGTLLATLRDRRSARLKGYDISDVALERARAQGLDVEVRDAPRESLDEVFDYVIIADCLERLLEPERPDQHPTWGIPLLKHVWPAMFAQNMVYVIVDPAHV